jgi:methylglyoxal synthase
MNKECISLWTHTQTKQSLINFKQQQQQQQQLTPQRIQTIITNKAPLRPVKP